MIDPNEWRARIFNAAELQKMNFPPMRFVVPGIVPEGATLLVSRPKLGKSWLVLDVAIATQLGDSHWGRLSPHRARFCI